MRSQLSLLHFFFAIASVHSNSEGDALHAWMIKLVDPNNLFQNWNPTMGNPCDWPHITCNIDNSVTRVDLGSGDLQGPLLPQLGHLINLRYLEVSNNSFYGSIPSEIGNLKSLISLGLQYNQLNGSIPAALGNLTSLRYLRLNSNQLTGRIPPEVIQLNSTGNLKEMNVSDNHLEETIQPTPNPSTGKSNKRTLPYVWTVVFETFLVVFLILHM